LGAQGYPSAARAVGGLGIGSGICRKERIILAAGFGVKVVFDGNKLDASSAATGEGGWSSSNRGGQMEKR
jgi:hypothetical protein